MIKVAISEFRAHMSKYLVHVMKGEVVLLTSHGKDVAELRQPTDRREAARLQLEQIAKFAKIDDIEFPVMDDFGVAS